ncbi:MAG: MerR family transcriptional regulator [Chloroflexota bacterium]
MDGALEYSIGRLAALTGLPVKTIRFYSDEGVLPPAGRTESGHRRYSQADLARLQLARSLRELDIPLPTIRCVLTGHGDLADIMQAHVATVEARIRSLQRQRAVLRAAAKSPSEAALQRVQALARLDAAERRQLLEHFWDRVLGDTPVHDSVAAHFRSMGTPDLPEEPSPEQLDAWLELAELAADEDFQRTTRENARWVWEASGKTPDQQALLDGDHRALGLVEDARQAGIEPSDERAVPAVAAFVDGWARLLGRPDSPAFRAWLLDQLDAHTDPRAARYWQLVGMVRGWSDAPAPVRERARAYAWLMEALRLSVRRAGR